MACLESITCDSNIDGSPFIKNDYDKILTAEEALNTLGKNLGTVITDIKTEMTSGGLDEYSLYINGASPAYDEANTTINNLSQVQEELGVIYDLKNNPYSRRIMTNKSIIRKKLFSTLLTRIRKIY